MIEQVNIELRTRNSAFQEDDFSFGYEMARILRQLANSLENGATPTYLMDINGNKVGEIIYKEEID